MYADNGVLGPFKKGMVLLDCSTSEPAMSERVAKDLAAGVPRDQASARIPGEHARGAIAMDAVCWQVSPLASVPVVAPSSVS